MSKKKSSPASATSFFISRRLFIIALLLSFGACLRLLVASMGHNFDMDSYLIVAKILEKGGNVYAQTDRYNYGPIWFQIIAFMYQGTRIFPYHFLAFRYGIVIFLTLFDIGIFWFLNRYFGLLKAFLYYFNPLSILLTGYHSQFDNIAVFLGFLSVYLWYEKRTGLAKIGCIVLLGISLATKHIFFAYPLWLAMRQKSLRWKVAILCVPICIFFLGFVPYWSQSQGRIIDHVFFYASSHNAPMWTMLIPDSLKRYITRYVLFFTALIIGGWVCRKKKPFDNLLWYCAFLVLFSPAMADQYFTIILPFMSVYWNVFFVFLSWIQSIHVVMMLAGGSLLIRPFNIYIDWDQFNYTIQVFLLFWGVASVIWWSYARNKSIRFVIATLATLCIIFILLFSIPSIYEDRQIAIINAPIQKGDYETANRLYSNIERDPPFAGSRFWYKLTDTRKLIEYYRNYRSALDAYNSAKEDKNWDYITQKLKNMPRGFYFQSTVTKMLDDAKSNMSQ